MLNNSGSVLATIANDYSLFLLWATVLPLVLMLWLGAYKTAGAYALFMAAVVLLLPAMSRPTKGTRLECMNHLKQLGLALHIYNQKYGSFPPAYIADAQGKPMHSWRVLILPIIERDDLYQQYRFDEPWNGPHNSQLAAQMPDIFRCPSDDPNNPSPQSGLETSYVAVVDPHAAWPGDRGRTLDEITDGLARTLLVVEVADSGIHWMEPRDLHLTQMAPTINALQGQGIGSHHPGGVNVAVADGSVTFLPESIAPNQLRALLTADGGEQVELP